MKRIWIYLMPDVTLNEFIADEGVEYDYYSPALHAFSMTLAERDWGEDLNNLSALPGVKSVQPLGKFRQPEPPGGEVNVALGKAAADSLYGAAYHQLSMLGIPRLNKLGYYGEGVRIGLLDQGFKKELPAFRDILDEGRLVAEYDFVYGDSITSDEDDEGTHGLAQRHGTGCWSIIGAHEPGKYIGGAYKAEFLVAKTEDMRWELPIEEDNYVAGMEWMVAHGADIVSVSLNYFDFDDDEYDYDYSDLDGRTTAAARICNWADRQGVIVVQSAGNEADDDEYSVTNGDKSLWTPADAIGVITVGSVNYYGNYSEFSSRGPTADGRIKPDVVAMGEGVYMIETNGSVRNGNGTSFSTPQIAAGIALLKEMHPEWNREDIMAKFRQFSALPYKNNDTGYGIPDIYKIAVGSESKLVSEIKLWPNPATAYIYISWRAESLGRSKLNIYDILGRRVNSIYSVSENSDFRERILLESLSSGVYFLRVNGETAKFVKL